MHTSNMKRISETTRTQHNSVITCVCILVGRFAAESSWVEPSEVDWRRRDHPNTTGEYDYLKESKMRFGEYDVHKLSNI